MLGKQTVDILSTLGRHFPYHFFVFSADIDNIFFICAFESKLSTFCRHSVDTFPIISLYFLRTLTIFFSFVLRKQTVDILSTLGRHFPYHFFVFSADIDKIFFICAFESKLLTFCRHSVDTFPIIPLYFLRTLTIFFSFVLRKQTVDILSTLGRHFPYHFFVFSADIDNIFSFVPLKANCRHFVDTRSTLSLSFLCIFCGH